MPKARTVRQAQMETVQGIAPAKPVAVDTLPTPEDQEAALEVKSHLITLLDDTLVELKTDLTVAQVLQQRLNAKVGAYALMIRSEVADFGNTPLEQTLSVIIAASDKLYERGIELLAQVTGKTVDTFRDNISAEQLTTAVLMLINGVEAAVKKAAAAQK